MICAARDNRLNPEMNRGLDMTIAAIIVAAGRGTRAGGDLPKQWQDLRGQPVIAHTIAALRPQ